jgi:O-antigen/teichoic acid export membrane protein
MRLSAGSRIAVSLADQAVVSGVRFVTSILIARTVGDDGLGVYSIAFGCLLIAICTQEALVAAPFTLFHARESGREKSRYHASALAQLIIIMVIASVGFSVASVGIYLRGNTSGLLAPMAVLAISSPFVLLQEFGRRVELARLRNLWALGIDTTSGSLQLLLLVLLASQGILNAANAYACLGIASAIPAFIWLLVAYRDLVFERANILFELRRHWSLARWSFLAQLIGLLHFQSMMWMMGWMLGPAAAGVFAACNYVTFFVNPFAIGISNALCPMAVRAYQHHGNARIRKLICIAMAVMAMGLTLFAIVLWSNADAILKLLYERDSFLGYGTLLLLLGLNAMLSVVHVMNDCGVWAIERPTWLLQSSLIVLGVTVAMAIPCMQTWGLVGGAYSLLGGRFAGLLYQSTLFFLATRGLGGQAPSPHRQDR